jgi:hypothetical protein
MSTLLGLRALNRSKRINIDGKPLTTDKTALVNVENPRVFRDLARSSTLGGAYIQVLAPFFQNDDGRVDQGGKVATRATTLVLDIGSVNFTRASGAKGSNPAATATLAAADVTNPRIDTVAINTTSGAIVVIAGTATAGASLFNLVGKGTVPASRVVLAYVLVPAATTTLTAVNVADARP